MTSEDLDDIESIRHWYQIPFATRDHVLIFGWAATCILMAIWVLYAINCEATR